MSAKRHCLRPVPLLLWHWRPGSLADETLPGSSLPRGFVGTVGSRSRCAAAVRSPLKRAGLASIRNRLAPIPQRGWWQGSATIAMSSFGVGLPRARGLVPCPDGARCLVWCCPPGPPALNASKRTSSGSSLSGRIAGGLISTAPMNQFLRVVGPPGAARLGAQPGAQRPDCTIVSDPSVHCANLYM
jgi:hypothetical protein